MEKSAEIVLTKSRKNVISGSRVTVLDFLMAGFVAWLMTQIGLEDVSGSQNRSTILFLISSPKHF